MKSTFAVKILPPLAAFLLARVFVILLATANGFDPLDGQTWMRGDSWNYLQIATDGYNLYVAKGFLNYPDGAWMGNTGWMPLYSWMIRLLMFASMPPIAAGIALAALFHLLTLMFLWLRFLRDFWNARGFVCLMFAAFFPSQVYQHAVFPISLFTFLALVYMDSLLSKRWWIAGLAGMAATLAYGQGAMIAPVGAMFLLLPPYAERLATIARRVAIVAGLPAVGLALLFLIFHFTTGKWNAFFLVQSKYHHQFHNPFANFWWECTFFTSTMPHAPAMAPQYLLINAGVSLLILWAAIGWKNRVPMDRVLVIFAAIFWIVPLSIGPTLSPLRPSACLLPMTPLLRHLPLGVLIALLCVAAILSPIAANIFFTLQGL